MMICNQVKNTENDNNNSNHNSHDTDIYYDYHICKYLFDDIILISISTHVFSNDILYIYVYICIYIYVYIYICVYIYTYMSKLGHNLRVNVSQ